MKKTFLLAAMLALSLMGCGAQPSQAPQSTLPEVQVSETVVATQPLPEVTEPPAPPEVLYPAQWEDGTVFFPCLLENREDILYTLEALSVTYSLEGETADTVSYDAQALAGFADFMDQSLVLDPGRFVLQRVPSTLEAEAFDRARLEFTLLDPQGLRHTQCFTFTPHPSLANASFAQDPGIWEYAAFENGNRWQFYHTITNLTSCDITLEAYYTVSFRQGIPVGIFRVETNRFGSTHLSDLKTLVPGQSKGWSSGFPASTQGTDPDRMKIVFVYRTEEGTLYIQQFNFLLDPQAPADADSALWPAAEVRIDPLPGASPYWAFAGEITNDTSKTLTLESIWLSDYLDQMLSGCRKPDQNRMKDFLLTGNSLAPGETLQWNYRISTDWPRYNRQQFVFVFRSEDGEAIFRIFRFSLPREALEALPEG